MATPALRTTGPFRRAPVVPATAAIDGAPEGHGAVDEGDCVLSRKALSGGGTSRGGGGTAERMVPSRKTDAFVILSWCNIELGRTSLASRTPRKIKFDETRGDHPNRDSLTIGATRLLRNSAPTPGEYFPCSSSLSSMIEAGGASLPRQSLPSAAFFVAAAFVVVVVIVVVVVVGPVPPTDIVPRMSSNGMAKRYLDEQDDMTEIIDNDYENNCCEIFFVLSLFVSICGNNKNKRKYC